MNKMHKVDRLFSSSFDEFVENIFQTPDRNHPEPGDFPFNNIGDYIDLLKEKKALEAQISRLKEKVFHQIADIRELKDKVGKLTLREKKLYQEKKLAESASRNKSHFLADMSHEIRTPMNGLMGTLSLLKETSLSSNQEKFLGIIETCAQSLLSLVDDVLDYSKIEAGELSIESIDFNLKEIVSQVKDIQVFKAQEKGIGLTTHIRHDVPVWLKGDPLRLRQILLNLVNNAIKFTESGSVQIEIENLTDTEDKVDLLFKVKDTGIGIKEEQQPYLFQSYTQANLEIARKFGGTGLGLSICKRLTDLMDGEIGVDSKPGEGSEFWFILPMVKQQGTQRSRNDLIQISQSQKTESRPLNDDFTVLLVEDDLISQKITKILLEKEGFNVLIAENGLKALEMLQSKNPINMVLMDIEMPGLNGYQTTEKIRNNLKSSIPIIAMTAHAMSKDRRNCLDAGMNDYVAKPVNIHVLNDAIDRILMESDTSDRLMDTESAAVPGHSVIEMDKLMSLRDEVEDQFGLLIDVFVNGLSEKITRIQTAILEENYDDLRACAHQLKGSCAAFYADRMVELCQHLEDIAQSFHKNPEVINNLMESLILEAEQVEHFIQKNLS